MGKADKAVVSAISILAHSIIWCICHIYFIAHSIIYISIFILYGSNYISFSIIFAGTSECQIPPKYQCNAFFQLEFHVFLFYIRPGVTNRLFLILCPLSLFCRRLMSTWPTKPHQNHMLTNLVYSWTASKQAQTHSSLKATPIQDFGHTKNY